MKNLTNTSTLKQITFDYGKKKVNLEHIRYFESYAGNYTLVKLENQAKICSSFTLKYYAQILDGETNFMLIRKGLLVNMQHVAKLTRDESGDWVTLLTGEKFKFSRRCAKSMQQLHKF